MDRALFYKKMQEEIDSLHQEDFNSPSVWFGIGLGAACAVKAFKEATSDEKRDPNVYVEQNGVKFYGQ